MPPELGSFGSVDTPVGHASGPRRLLLGLTAANSLAAVAGGCGLLAGGLRLDPAILARTPFPSGLLAGGALLAWIAVQVAMIGLVSSLQPLFFGLGLAIIAAALRVHARSAGPVAHRDHPG